MLSCCCIFGKLRTIHKLIHVRLKSSNETLKESVKLSEEVLKRYSEILRETLGCNIHTARKIISRNRNITDISHNSFYQNVKFIEEHLKLSDLVEFPCLLTLQPSLLQHRYFSLKELGFYDVTPYYILSFSHILKETPQALKKKRYPFSCKYKSDILNEYLNASKRTEISGKLQQLYKDGSDLRTIREMMNAEFLAAKLECSIGKAQQMLHRFAALRVQSILNTDQLLNMLLYKFGFPFSKIHRSLHLLSIHHQTVEDFLSEFPEILGMNTVTLVRKLPLLLKQESDYIHKVQAVLKDFNINKDQLNCCPAVLLIAPDTLQKRLTAICSTEDFAVLKSNKKFLWLVHYYNNLSSRIKYLKAENMPCSINMITTSKRTFEKYLLYNNTRTCIGETYVYLAEIFKMSEKEIFNRLHHFSHVQSEDLNFSTLNCRRVIEFLLLSGVTKEQIFSGLEIVFYDIDTVKIYFNNLKTHPQCQPYEEWISHYNFIQLLIYTIEVIKYCSYEIESDEQEGLFLEYSN